MHPTRTLVVEDASAQSSPIQRALKRSGDACYTVERRRTVKSALARLSAGQFDVVLLDLDLPDSEGLESVVRLHDAAPDVPIVVVTDSDAPNLDIRALEAHAADYLVKSAAERTDLDRSIRLARERQRAHATLCKSSATTEANLTLLRRLVEASAHGVVVVAHSGPVLFANPSAVELLGRSASELHGEALGFPFSAESPAELTIGTERVIEVRTSQVELDGASVWVATLVDITGHRRQHAALEASLTRTRSSNAQLARLARLDPLTELLNRRGLASELAAESRRRRRSGTPLAAILLDCDDFKHVNELLGHAGGDEALREVARRLRGALRPSDHVGRIGGDEFLVLLPETSLAEAREVAERLRHAIAEVVLPAPNGSVGLTASMGLEAVPESASIDALIALAERSLQLSKRMGKNRVTAAAGRTSEVTQARRLLRRLEAGTGLRVACSPIVAVADERVHAWALTVRGPLGGFQPPRDFLHLTLDRELLSQVDLACLRLCVEHSAALPSDTLCHIGVLPSTLLAVPTEQVVETLRERHPMRRFCLELSEQQFAGDPSALLAAALKLKAAGILLAIEGLGTDRSSLEKLVVLEPDVVKLDAGFVRSCAADPSRERSLRRVARAVAALGSRLFADGVDSLASLAQLRSLGATHAQGGLWPVRDDSAASAPR